MPELSAEKSIGKGLKVVYGFILFLVVGIVVGGKFAEAGKRFVCRTTLVQMGRVDRACRTHSPL